MMYLEKSRKETDPTFILKLTLLNHCSIAMFIFVTKFRFVRQQEYVSFLEKMTWNGNDLIESDIYAQFYFCPSLKYFFT